MDPQAQFCHNPDCPARGQLGLGNIRVHSRNGAALPLHHLRPDLRRDPRHAALPPQEADRTGDHRADLALPRLPAAGDRRRLRARRADRRRLAGPGGPARPALPRASRPERAGRAGARPGRRAVRQGGGPAALDGHGDGRPVAALARRGDQPPPRPDADHGRGADGPPCRPEPGDPGLRRWPGQLRDGLRAGLPRPGADGPPRAGRGWCPRPGCCSGR